MAGIRRTETKQDEIVFLEHALLKVPYEHFNRKYRQAQKALEREHVILKEVEPAGTDTEDKEALLQQLKAMQERLESVEQKVISVAEKEMECYDKITTRCTWLNQHLKNISHSPYADPAAAMLWERKREDRMLVDYCTRCGFYDTAKAIAKDGNVEEYIDMEFFVEVQRVQDALMAHNLTPCLSWCADNRTKLKKLKCMLEFNCRQREFVELIRAGSFTEGLTYARKHFSNVEPELQERVNVLMGLLAFGCNTTSVRYQKLLSDGQWVELASQFRRNSYLTHQLSSKSMLDAVLQAGMSAMKSQQCFDTDPHQKNSDCPICNEPYNTLARALPFKRVSHSKLVCHISRKPMGEPMMLPNGRVYDLPSLRAMAAASNGTVTCPRTGDVYAISAIKKVFVM